METLRNAAEALLGTSTEAPAPEQQEKSGKEPGTGSTETGEGGIEPYDPGNKEEQADNPVSPASAHSPITPGATEHITAAASGPSDVSPISAEGMTYSVQEKTSIRASF